jgi:hypothetical protein
MASQGAYKKEGFRLGDGWNKHLEKRNVGTESWFYEKIVIVFISVVFFGIPFELLYTTFNQHIASGLLK